MNFSLDQPLDYILSQRYEVDYYLDLLIKLQKKIISELEETMRIKDITLHYQLQMVQQGIEVKKENSQTLLDTTTTSLRIATQKKKRKREKKKSSNIQTVLSSPVPVTTTKNIKSIKRKKKTEKTFTCTICARKYAHSFSLKRHIRHKHNEIPSQMIFFCSYANCEKKFSYLFTCNRHEETCHLPYSKKKNQKIENQRELPPLQHS